MTEIQNSKQLAFDLICDLGDGSIFGHLLGFADSTKMAGT